MKKILYTGVGHEIGGVERLVKFFASNFNSKYEIHILAACKSNIAYESFFSSNNIKIHYLNNIFGLNSVLQRKKIIENFLNKNQFDIIHINANSLNTVYIAEAAQKVGCNNIIYHIHNLKPSGQGKIISCLTELLQPFFRNRLLNISHIKVIAVSNAIRKKIFKNSNRVQVIKNGINVSKFKFSKRERKNLRKKLGLGEKEIVGVMVARFTPIKNFDLAIKVVSSGLEKNIFSSFFFIGDGPKMEYVKKKIKVLPLEIKNKIFLVGQKENISDWLSMADFFLLTSLYEGLSNSVIEAEASGLPCVISKGVPNEVDVTGCISFLSIYSEPNDWVKSIERITENKKNRIKINNLVYDSEFSNAFFERKIRRLYE